MRVAIQGIRGSYSEEAAMRLLGQNASIVECDDFLETFDSLEKGTVDHVIVPVENKIVGAIQAPTEILRARGLKVLERLELKVMHVLTGTFDAEFESISSIRSHVEALKQCNGFFANHPHISRLVGVDTAGSVRQVVDEGISTNAAIGSQRAAEMYGAKILKEKIADDIDNWTTFCLIGN